jgi:hypothetical protein
MEDSNVYKPLSADRELNYLTSPQMTYRERTPNEKAGLSHCPNIKMLINDVAFLTEKAKAGDLVIYVGGTIGAYLPLVAKMFLTLHFLVYYGHPESMHYKNEQPPNMHLKAVWFSQQEAVNFVNLQMPKYDPRRTLLMVDTRNVTQWVKLICASFTYGIYQIYFAGTPVRKPSRLVPPTATSFTTCTSRRSGCTC